MTTATAHRANVVSLRDYKSARADGDSTRAPISNHWSASMLLRELADQYFTDSMSGVRKLRPVTQTNYESQTRRLVADLGHYEIEDITIRILKAQHAVWSADGKITMGHGIISMFRIIVGFGAGILEDKDCQRIRGSLASVKFPNAKPRSSILTAEQVFKICDLAFIDGQISACIGYLLQHYCCLRQKDVIGELVRIDADPRPSKVIFGDYKWVGGLLADNISADRVLTHTTSKKNKKITIPLADCPLIEQEWASLPKSGPLIIDPRTGRPFQPWNYVGLWRKYADKAGVPREVFQMDTRAGRITGMLASGVNPNDVRLFATHAQLSTTMGYARGDDEGVVRALDTLREQQVAA